MVIMDKLKSNFEALDIDWFFIDNELNLYHVASGGGIPPKSIQDNFDTYYLIQNYFNSLPILSENVIVKDNLELFISFVNDDAKIKYLSTFIEFAKKGLISFDKSDLTNTEDSIYHLVVSPKVKLDISTIPNEIYEKIKKTVFNKNGNSLTNVNISEIM